MQDTYQELTITVEPQFVELIADYISNIFDDSLEIGDETIIIRSESDLAHVRRSLEELRDTLGEGFKIGFNLEEKEAVDWIKKYQNSIEPIEASQFYIYPSWYPPKEGKINITIDPALAFGSGHHATTFSCLEAISEQIKGGERVLDVGCGSGILGLACTKLGARAELCDTDPLSIQSAQENFALNSAQFDQIWEGSANKANGEYDIVLANIIADVLRFIAKDLIAATKPGGALILSGILDTKEPLVRPSYESLTLIERKQKEEWVTLIYKKDTDEQ